MPSYCLKCPQCGLQHDAVLVTMDPYNVPCPKPGCGCKTSEVDWSRNSVRIQREWHGAETQDMELCFAKDADFASIKRDCPSMELRQTKAGFHRPVYRNNAHQRRVYKELDAAMKRHKTKGVDQ